jgi:hypothetical protein
MKKNKLPRPISILILTLLTVVVWISLNIYRAIAVKPASEVPESVSSTFTPTLNKDFINKIESSLFLDDSQIPQNIVVPSGSNTPVPTAIPIAVPTLTPTPTPESTQSATIQ